MRVIFLDFDGVITTLKSRWRLDPEKMELVKKIKPEASVNIIVNHMVNSKGVENLSKNFDRVWFSNSYKTWKNLPDNVTQIGIVK